MKRTLTLTPHGFLRRSSGQFDYMGEPFTKVNLLSLVDRESDLLKKLVGLSAVDPAGENRQQKLPGMENNSHDLPEPTVHQPKNR